MRNVILCLLLLPVLLIGQPPKAGGTPALPGPGQALSGTAAVHGQVLDQTGGVLPGVAVTLTGPGGERQIKAGELGQYSFRGLPPGQYSIKANFKGFAPFQTDGLALVAGQDKNFDFELLVTLERQKVDVTDTNTAKLDVDPTNNAGAIILKGQDLDALPDDPDDMASELQALAGPAAGPNGGQIYIDGFTGGRLSPKESIREIRINQNPFAAEFERIGFGRIEIFTRPGANRFRGSTNFNFGDSIFNSRNPFATTKPPYQQKTVGANLSGPITKKSSFFLDFNRRMADEVSVVNARILDPSFQVATFSSAVLNPSRRTEANGRVDYALTPNHTLMARYSYEQGGQINDGVSTFSLPTRAYDTSNHEHSITLTETSILNVRAVNETRFQFRREDSDRKSRSLDPAIQVLEAFTGGGAGFGLGFDNQNRFELHNFTSLTRGKHLVKFGGRLRGVSVDDFTTQGYSGSYTFTSLDAYRITLQGIATGLAPEQIRAAGGGASQFSISGGQSLAGVSRTDVGLYAQDDWRARGNLTLSYGVRYETQTNIHDHSDFAPRVGFAVGLGKSRTNQPTTVLRGGFGLFYDRLSENLTLQAQRQDGVHQQQFIVPFPTFFPAIPAVETLVANRQPLTIREVDAGLRSHYMAQSALSLERQLPKNISLGLTWTNTRGVHVLRSRNINAPVPGLGIRPNAGAGNLYLYEGSGLFRQNQITANVNARVNSKLQFFGFYSLNYARSNADGAGSFPANQYDLSGEYGRAGFDTRHRAVLSGSIAAPWGLRLSPIITISSGGPYNITTGRDLNGDSVFTDRPAFATDLTRSSVVSTPLGVFDTQPLPGQKIIPRNYGQGPGAFTVNLRLGKTWSFGERPASAADASQGGRGGRDRQAAAIGRLGGSGGGPRGGGGGGGPRGGGGGGFAGLGDFGGGATPGRYSVTFSIFARNLFNHVNLSSPVGNLSSPLFGQSNSIGGGFGGFGGGGGGATANRRIELQLRFGF